MKLQRALFVTQSDVASKTGLAQSLVTWLEEQPVCDLDVTTLAVYLRGLGGRLEAVIPAPALGGTRARNAWRRGGGAGAVARGSGAWTAPGALAGGRCNA